MNKLLPTGSCGLYSIHLAFKTGEISTDWGVKKILQSFLTIFQYAKPMTPFIHDDFYQLLKDLTSKFMKKEVLD